jgi:hypothetical protein
MIFTGAIIAQMVKMYMRYDEPKDYKACSVFIDEAQNFCGAGFMDVALREGRKYNLALLLSTQTFAGMPNDLVKLMLMCGNIVAFQISYAEAAMLAKEFDFQPQQFQFIEKWHAAYLTRESRGIVEVTRPPYIPKVEIQVAPKKTPPKWFRLVSYQP